MTSKFTRDTPALAYLEQQILQKASSAGLLLPAVKAIEANYKLPSGTLGNGYFYQTRMLSMFFNFLVVPREILTREKNLSIIKLEKYWSIAELQDESRSKIKNIDTHVFLRRIRNAVAHARFDFTNKGVKFWDGRDETKCDFEVELQTSEVEHMLNKVGQFFADHRHSLEKI